MSLPYSPIGGTLSGIPDDLSGIPGSPHPGPVQSTQESHVRFFTPSTQIPTTSTSPDNVLSTDISQATQPYMGTPTVAGTVESIPHWVAEVPLARRQYLVGRIHLISNGERKYVHIYEGEVVSVGRHRNATLTLSTQYSSSWHFEIMVVDNLVFLKNISVNGTKLRGTTIGKGKSAVLSDGDHINVANSAVLEYQSTPNSRFASDAFDYKKLVEPYYIITPKIIGEGTFAKVHVACDQRNPAKLVAVKIISKGKVSQEQRRLGSLAVDMHKEIEILRSIKHPNIITILDVVQTSSFIYIFFDRMEGGDLLTMIQERRYLSPGECKFLIFQLTLALEHLHKRNIAHRDIKPENILLEDTERYPRIYLTDFGMARTTSSTKRLNTMRTVCGTLQYLAPEVMSKPPTRKLSEAAAGGYGLAVDMWAMGVTLYTALSGSLPFDARDPEGDGGMDEEESASLFDQIQAADPPFAPCAWSNVPARATSMVKGLLQPHPEDRLTVKGVLDHPWILESEGRLKRLYAERVLGFNEETIGRKTAEGCFSQRVL